MLRNDTINLPPLPEIKGNYDANTKDCLQKQAACNAVSEELLKLKERYADLTRQIGDENKKFIEANNVKSTLLSEFADGKADQNQVSHAQMIAKTYQTKIDALMELRNLLEVKKKKLQDQLNTLFLLFDNAKKMIFREIFKDQLFQLKKIKPIIEKTWYIGNTGGINLLWDDFLLNNFKKPHNFHLRLYNKDLDSLYEQAIKEKIKA